MAETNEDPREVAWHPRFAKSVIGHDEGKAHFTKAFATGRPHHAWLIHGTKGIGKATLAYHLAWQVGTIQELASARDILLREGSLGGESDHGATTLICASCTHSRGPGFPSNVTCTLASCVGKGVCGVALA